MGVRKINRKDNYSLAQKIGFISPLSSCLIPFLKTVFPTSEEKGIHDHHIIMIEKISICVDDLIIDPNRWLETIEITDVKILSGSLFKDMQCTFREDNNKTATLQKLEVDQEIRIQKENHDLTTKKRTEDTRKTKRIEESSRNIKNKQQEVEATKKSIAI